LVYNKRDCVIVHASIEENNEADERKHRRRRERQGEISIM
jgi:hypothetical protein